MIDLNRASIQSDGLTLFPSATDSNLWYFLPTRPRISRTPEGRLSLVLVKYRGDLSGEGPPGGGILKLAVDLGTTPVDLDGAVHMLRSLQPGVSPLLVPLPAERVTCELQLWTGHGDSHSTVSSEPAVDSLHSASFEVPLTMQGATLFQHALQSNLAPASVVYELTAAARRPALPAKITIDWRGALEFFRMQGAIGEPFHPGQIASSVERLAESGVIRFQIALPRSTGQRPLDGIQKEVIDEAVSLVMNELFEAGPVMVDAAPAGAAAGGIDRESSERVSLGSQTYRLKSSAGDLRTATYDLGQPGEDTRVVVVSAALNSMIEGVETASLIVELEEPPTRPS